MDKNLQEYTLTFIVAMFVIFIIYLMILIFDYTEAKDYKEEWENSGVHYYCHHVYGKDFKSSYDDSIDFKVCSRLKEDNTIEKHYYEQEDIDKFSEVFYCKEEYFWRLNDC